MVPARESSDIYCLQQHEKSLNLYYTGIVAKDFYNSSGNGQLTSAVQTLREIPGRIDCGGQFVFYL